MHGVHFREEWKRQGLEVLVSSIDEHGAVFDLRLMAFARLELHLSFQVNVPCREQALLDVGIKRSDREPKLWVVSDNLIRGLPLRNQWRDDLVHLEELLVGEVDSGSGVGQLLAVFSFGELCVVTIFVSDCAMVDFLGAPVADIRCPV